MTHRLEEEERYLKLTAREIRRLCMLTLAFIRQASYQFRFVQCLCTGVSFADD